MHAFLSKVFGRKKEDKEPSPTILQPGELLDGKFEAVSPNVSPAANNFLELDPKANGQDAQDKDKDGVFALFRAKSRPSSPEIKPKKLTDTLPQLSLNFAGPGESSDANTIDSLLELDIDSQILLSETVIGERRLNPLEALVLIRACSQAIVSTGLETLGVMHPHWYSSSPEVQRRLISQFIHSLKPAPQGLMTPLSLNSTLLTPFEAEVNSRSPYDVAAVLRWGLRHLQLEGDHFGTDDGWYKAFLDAEAAASYPPKAFSEKLAPKLPSAHLDLLIATLEIISSLAAHSEANGTSGNKLSKIFGLWLLTARRVEEQDDWHSFYQRWERTGRMLEHLFLARIRDESSDQRMPVRLLELVRKYPYTQGLSSPTTDLQLLPPSRFSTQPRDALFVRIEVELPLGKRKPKSKIHPLNLLADAFSTKVEEGDYAEIWAKITAASKNGTNPSPLSNIFADETIRFLSIIPEANKPQQSKSPAFSVVSPLSPRRQSFTVAETAKGEGQTQHTKLATDPLPITPISATEIGSDWAQFSSSGFLDSTPAMPPLVSTLFDTDVEKTVPPDPSLSRKSSKRTRPPAASRKSVDFAAEPINAAPPKEKAAASESEIKTIVKASKIEIIEVDEAFIDFWSDSLLDPITLNWPTFIICKFKSTIIPQLTYGPAVEGQNQKTLKWLVLEQVFTVRSPTPSPPVETVELVSPSSPTPSTSSRKIFSFFSRSTSGSSIGSQKGKKKERTPKIGEMGELLEEDTEVGQPRISFSRSKKSMDRRTTNDSVSKVEEKDKATEKAVSDNQAARYVSAAVAIGAISTGTALATTSTKNPQEKEQSALKVDEAETELSDPIVADARLTSSVDEPKEGEQPVLNVKEAELQLADTTITEAHLVSTAGVEPIDELTEQVQPLSAIMTETLLASAPLDGRTQPEQSAPTVEEMEIQPFDTVVTETEAEPSLSTIDEVDIQPSIAVVFETLLVSPSVEEPIQEADNAMPTVEEANAQPPSTFVTEVPSISSSLDEPEKQPLLAVVETELRPSDPIVAETSIPTKVEQSVPTVEEVEVESSSAIVTEEPPVSACVDEQQNSGPSQSVMIAEAPLQEPKPEIENEGKAISVAEDDDHVRTEVTAGEVDPPSHEVENTNVSPEPALEEVVVEPVVENEEADHSPVVTAGVDELVSFGVYTDPVVQSVEGDKESDIQALSDDPTSQVETSAVSGNILAESISDAEVVPASESTKQSVENATETASGHRYVQQNLIDIEPELVEPAVEKANEVFAERSAESIEDATPVLDESQQDLVDDVQSDPHLPVVLEQGQVDDNVTKTVSEVVLEGNQTFSGETNGVDKNIAESISVDTREGQNQQNQSEGIEYTTEPDFAFKDETIPSEPVTSPAIKPHEALVTESPQQEGEAPVGEAEALETVYSNRGKRVDDAPVQLEDVNDIAKESDTAGLNPSVKLSQTANEEKQVVVDVSPFAVPTSSDELTENTEVALSEEFESNVESDATISKNLTESHLKLSDEPSPGDDEPETAERSARLSATNIHRIKIVTSAEPTENPIAGEYIIKEEEDELPQEEKGESNITVHTQSGFDESESLHVVQVGEEHTQEVQSISEANSGLVAGDLVSKNIEKFGIADNDGVHQQANLKHDGSAVVISSPSTVETVAAQENPSNTSVDLPTTEAPLPVEDKEIHSSVPLEEATADEGHLSAADAIIETDSGSSEPNSFTIPESIALETAKEHNEAVDILTEETLDIAGNLSANCPATEVQDFLNTSAGPAAPSEVQLERPASPEAQEEDSDAISQQEIPKEGIPIEPPQIAAPVPDGSFVPGSIISGNDPQVLATVEEHGQDTALRIEPIAENNVSVEGQLAAPVQILEESLPAETHADDKPPNEVLVAESTEDQLSKQVVEQEGGAAGIETAISKSIAPEETCLQTVADDQLQGTSTETREINASDIIEALPSQTSTLAASELDSELPADHPKEPNHESGLRETEEQDTVEGSNQAVEIVSVSGESEDVNDLKSEQDVYVGSSSVEGAQEESSILDTIKETLGEVAPQTVVSDAIDVSEDIVPPVEVKSDNDAIITEEQTHGNMSINEEVVVSEASVGDKLLGTDRQTNDLVATNTANADEGISSSAEPGVTSISYPEESEPTSTELDPVASSTHVIDHVVEKSLSSDNSLPSELEVAIDKTARMAPTNQPDSPVATEPVPELSAEQTLLDSDIVATLSEDLIVSSLQEAATTEVSAQDVERTHKERETAVFVSPDFSESLFSETGLHITRPDEPLISSVDLAVANGSLRSALPEFETASVPVPVTQDEVDDLQEPEILKEIDAASGVEEMPKSILQSEQSLSDSVVPTDGHHLEENVSTPEETIIAEEHPLNEQEGTSDLEQIHLQSEITDHEAIEDEEVQLERNPEPAGAVEDKTERVEPAEYEAESAGIETVETPLDEAQSTRVEAGSDEVNHPIGHIEAAEHADEATAIKPVELDEPEITDNAEGERAVTKVFEAETVETETAEPEAIEAQSGGADFGGEDDTQDVPAQPEAQSNVENTFSETREPIETRPAQTEDAEPQHVGQLLDVEPETTSDSQRSENLQEYIITSQPEKASDDNAKVEDVITQVETSYTPESITEIATTAPEVVETIEDFQQKEPEAQKINQVSESTNESQFLQLDDTLAERVTPTATTSNDDEKNVSGSPDNNFTEENKKDPTVFSTSEEGVGSIVGEEGSSLVVKETLSIAEPSELVTPTIVEELDETPSGAPDASASDELKTVVIVAEAMSPNEEAVIQVIDDSSEETTVTEDNVVVLPESSESLEGSQTRSDAKDDTGLESANISDIPSTNSSSDTTKPVDETNGPSNTSSIAEPISVEQDVVAVTVIPTEDELPSLAKEAVGAPGLAEVSITLDGENLLSLPDPTSAEKDTIASADVVDPVVEEGSSTLAEEIMAVSEPSEVPPPVVEEFDTVTSSVAASEAESSEKSEVIDTATNEDVVPNESSEPKTLSSVKEHIPIEEVPEPCLDDELPVVIEEGIATSFADSLQEHVLTMLQTDERGSPKQNSAAILETDNEVVAEEPSSLIADEISGISEHSNPPIPVVPEESNVMISSVGGPDASGAELETIETTTNKDIVPDEEVGAGAIDDLPVHDTLPHFVQETYPAQDSAHEPSKSLETDSVAEVKTDHEAQPITNEPEPEFVVVGEAVAKVADSPVLTEPENAAPLSVTTGDMIPEAVVESELTHLSEQGPATDNAEQTAVTIDEPEIPPTDEDVTVEAKTTIQDNSVVVDQAMATAAEDSVFVDDDIITDEADPVGVTETAKGIQEPLDVPEEEIRLEQVADTEINHPAPSQPSETKPEIIEDPVLDVDSKVEYAEAASLNGNGHHSVQPFTEKNKSVSEILQADESMNGAVDEETDSAALQEPIASDIDNDITPTVDYKVTEDLGKSPETKAVINVLDPEPKVDDEQRELVAESIAKEAISE